MRLMHHLQILSRNYGTNTWTDKAAKQSEAALSTAKVIGLPSISCGEHHRDQPSTGMFHRIADPKGTWLNIRNDGEVRYLRACDQPICSKDTNRHSSDPQAQSSRLERAKILALLRIDRLIGDVSDYRNNTGKVMT